MPKTARRKHYIIGVIVVVLAAIGLYGVLPRIGSFKESMGLLQEADPVFIVLAATASLLAAACSALIYYTLAVRRVKYRQALIVQLSGLLVNRILPAGIGGLGLNYLFLRSHRHNMAEATTIVTLNNFIGLSGHIVLALGLFLLAPTVFDSSTISLTWIALAVGLALAFVITAAIVWRQRSVKMRTWKRTVGFYATHPQKIWKALTISLVLTLCNVTSLWLCSHALDVELSFFAVFVVFTFGILVGTATPTPGGLGGTEAALVGAFMAQGITANLSLAVALLFRLVSYWFGLIVGAFASWYMYRADLLGLKKTS